MANRSWLLGKVFEQAEDSVRSDGKRGVSADYFVVSLLNVVSALRGGTLEALRVDEATKEKTRTEIANIDSLLNKYNVDVEIAARKLGKAISEKRSESALDVFFFNKTVFAAENKAVEAKKQEIGADIYLDIILFSPSETMQRCVINTASAGSPSGSSISPLPIPSEDDSAGSDALSDEALSHIFDDIDLLDGQYVTEETAPAVKKTGAAKKTAKIDSLVNSVKKVKEVQQKLLDAVYGQDHAVSTFVSGYFQAELLSLTQEKRTQPLATFLFAGPPGVGKTFLAEQAAEVLKLPYRRFDMSEYCEKESNLQFAGSDKVYKNGQPGLVTSFVEENPKCILLFDEIEKAHLNVIHLFLQILDAGRIRDNFTAEEVSFANAILIFTTNAGKKLYDDPTVTNLSSISRKTVLNALSVDINPETDAPLFPAAICSRFASGNVIMFNRLDAHDLLKIVDKELAKHSRGFSKKTGIKLKIDPNVPYAIMFSEGGKADARAMRGKATNFLYQELYELFRIISSEKNKYKPEDVKSVAVTVSLPDEGDMRKLFSESTDAEILVFADGNTGKECKKLLKKVKAHIVSDVEAAKETLAKYDISVILCDVTCKTRSTRGSVLNLEDIDSEGRDFFVYVNEYVNKPVYLLEAQEGFISQEEYLSFAREGARGVICVKKDGKYDFQSAVLEKCNIERQQNNLLELAKANKVVAFQTAQRFTMDGGHAEIVLFDFKQGLAADAEDNKNILSDVSKPDVRFDDVIGAEDAKDELKYFVEYLKHPAKFARSGVRVPKGILLYGPPGTGKTLLAKAMAGESDVTFINTQGNSFLKKYVSEGVETVHSLFNMARKYAPSILFVDEIDAVGKNRNDPDGYFSSEILTAFLTEMDGFDVRSDKPVFVLAATNFNVESGEGRALDPALIRRFDNKIFVDLPNKAERGRFLEMKVGGKGIFEVSEAEIDNIAVRSAGMSLAELELVTELAMRNAIKAENLTVNDEILEDAFESFNSGEVKKWAPGELERTARHEAGHALLCWLSGETPSYLTIVARGNHGGYMQHGDGESKSNYTKEELLLRIRTMLGGRAAEIAYYGEENGISTGASSDLQNATITAEHMICSYGMDEVIGPGCVDLRAVAGSAYYTVIRDRVNATLKSELAKAVETVSGHRDAVDKLVAELMLKNHMKGPEIDKILSSVIKR